MTAVDRVFLGDVLLGFKIPCKISEDEEFVSFGDNVMGITTFAVKDIVRYNHAFINSSLPRELFVKKAIEYVRENLGK